jgi:hypothetical protein
MPVIQTAPEAAGGGGDATAANQIIQIAAEQGAEGILLDVLSSIAANGVGIGSAFKDPAAISVFLDDSLNESVFKLNSKSKVSTVCISFADTSPSTLSNQIQTFLQSNQVYVVSLTYADGGVIGPNQHSAILVYNQ